MWLAGQNLSLALAPGTGRRRTASNGGRQPMGSKDGSGGDARGEGRAGSSRDEQTLSVGRASSAKGTMVLMVLMGEDGGG